MPTQFPQSTSQKHEAPAEAAELSPGRRSLLQGIIGLIGTGIAAVLAFTIGRFTVAPAFTPMRDTKWIELGTLEALPENQLLRKNITITQEAGWGHFAGTRLLWVMRRGETLTIFSGVCPHLGCTVSTKDERFICACHNSQWDAQGNKLAGPAPRALDTLAYKIENGLVLVNYEDFRQGISAKEVLS